MADSKHGSSVRGALLPGSNTAGSSNRARRKCFGKNYYMPHRASDADRERDQVLLSQIPANLSREQFDAAVVSIKKQREEERGSQIATEASQEQAEARPASIKRQRKDEMTSRGSADCAVTSSAGKRARCKRNGKDFVGGKEEEAGRRRRSAAA